MRKEQKHNQRIIDNLQSFHHPRISLTRALENLKLIFENNKKKFIYKIEDDQLFVFKTPSKSQNKNVLRKIKKLK